MQSLESDNILVYNPVFELTKTKQEYILEENKKGKHVINSA